MVWGKIFRIALKPKCFQDSEFKELSYIFNNNIYNDNNNKVSIVISSGYKYSMVLWLRQKTHDWEVLGSNPHYGDHFSCTIHLEQRLEQKIEEKL